MGKANCWEYRMCGREPGGARADELGVCPVTTDVLSHGVNCGVNGGRWCWVVRGTLCETEGLEALRDQVTSCGRCDFFRLVQWEEGDRHHEMTVDEEVAQLN